MRIRWRWPVQISGHLARPWQAGQAKKKVCGIRRRKSVRKRQVGDDFQGSGGCFLHPNRGRKNAWRGNSCSLSGQYGLTHESRFWEFKEAKVLAGGKSLVEIVREHAKIRPPDLNPISVKEAVAEFLAVKAGKSRRHLRDLTYKLKAFSKDFSGSLPAQRKLGLHRSRPTP